MPSFTIKQTPILETNYSYLLTCHKTGTTAVVDPAAADPITKALGKRRLHFILNTHHHHDHVGGNIALKQRYGCKIIGSGYDPERIPALDTPVKEKDHFFIGQTRVDVLFTPGHTRGHIMFYIPEVQALFCGDVLFAGGCGRLFEGSAEEMFTSLQKIKALPDATKVYCAHEYTLGNYIFATHTYPEDETLKTRYNAAKTMREHNKPTVPTTLLEEKTSNIFLKATDVATFSALRKAKDAF